MKSSFLGLMFHHFHNNKKIMPSQGSITKDKFYKIIKFFGKENIIKPTEFLENFEKKKLKITKFV